MWPTGEGGVTQRMFAGNAWGNFEHLSPALDLACCVLCNSLAFINCKNILKCTKIFLRTSPYWNRKNVRKDSVLRPKNTFLRKYHLILGGGL